MDIINLLPENIANQIAAGEVIQRPASVVKETIENSIDSGASEIQLYIKDSGKTLIQIVDNGCGMSFNDVEKCFLRHATSKINKVDDLFKINTMGFRGEAMASIASIAQVELETKLKNKELGTRIIIEGGKIKNKIENNCADGTSIKVKNIFFNVPARRKFLKSDSVEMRHIVEEFNRIALINYNCKMQLSHNNKEILFYPKSNFRQRIVNVIGLKNNEHLVPVNEKTSLVEIDGFICKPQYAKKTKGEQYIFVNKRFIKNTFIQNTISKAFEGLISEKHYPSYFINLKINPKNIDVNIHPTKTEIKFEDEKSIYAIIKSTVQKSLGEYNVSPSIDFLQENSFNIDANFDKPIKQPEIKVDQNYNPFKNESTLEEWNKNEFNQVQISNEEEFDNKSVFKQLDSKLFVQIEGDKIYIFHKKRAQKRILYDFYINTFKHKKSECQKLAFPISIPLSNKDYKIFKLISSKLLDLGFKFEFDHSNNIKFTGLPVYFTKEKLKDNIEDIINEYENFNLIENNINKSIALSLTKIVKFDEKSVLNEFEMRNISEELKKCENASFCPNGKPILMNIDSKEIQKFFK